MKRFYNFLLKLTLLSLLIGFYTNAGFAAIYYVSNTGSDTNSGQSSSSPWQTLAKVNSVTLMAGDQVLFEKGDTFYGSLTVKNSGASGSPITIGAYGSGAAPVITGFTTVSGWTNLGSNIWESTSAVSTLSTCNMVVINGVNTAMGRYPSASAANGGYLSYQSHSARSSITSSSLTGTPNWTGAEAVIRTSSWTLDRAAVTSQSSGTLNINSTLTYDPKDGYGFFIQNHVQTLTYQDAWYYNPSTKKIRIYSTTQPTGVQTASVDNLLTLHGSYITVDGITFSGANNRGVYNETSSYNHVTLQNCGILYCGVIGVSYAGDYLTINACNISDCNSRGIEMSNNDYCTLTNSTIQNTGVLAGMGEGGIGTRTAVHADTDNHLLIQYNRIINTGYVGINTYGTNINISNNFVDTFCSVLDDGAGIYTYTGTRAAVSAMTISNNIVINGKGATYGKTGVPNQANGIYLDDNSKNVQVTGNTIGNCGSFGIFLHDASYSTVQNNTCYSNGGSGVGAQLYYMDDNGNASNDNIQNNLFFADPASAWTVQYRSVVSSVINLNGTFDYNYYVQINNPNIPIRFGTTSYTINNYSLESWITFSGRDANSKKSPQTITSEADLQFEYNATKSAKTVTLSRPMMDVKGVKYTSSVTLQPYTSVVLIGD